MTHRKIKLLITLLAMAALAVMLVMNRNGNALARASQEEAEIDAEPVVDYAQANIRNAGQGEKKKHHSLRADRPIAELPPGVEPLPVTGHWWIGLPPLPAAQSDAVIYGEIVDGQALLDDDKMGIYSVFSVRVVETFKGGQELCTFDGMLTAMRPGGAVRFPSSKVQRYRITKQGFPKRGRQYVLFLKRSDQGELSILTGYELRAGRVMPLDGDDKDPRGDLQFARYRGADEESFMHALREAVQASPPGGGR
jgi:hypothetical protein